MGQRNKRLVHTLVSWTLNQDAVKTITVSIPALSPSEGRFLIVCKNGSAVVALTLAACNTYDDMDADTVAEVDSGEKMTIAAAGTEKMLLDAWLIGSGGLITLTKSAVTEAAFSSYVDVYQV